MSQRLRLSVVYEEGDTYEEQGIAQAREQKVFLETMVDEHIQEFCSWFQSKTEPATRFERAFLKTYLMYQLGQIQD